MERFRVKTPCPVVDCKAIATTEFSEEITALPEKEREVFAAKARRNVAIQMRKGHEEGKHVKPN